MIIGNLSKPLAVYLARFGNYSSSPPSRVKNTTEDGSPSPTEVLAETVALYGMYLTGNNEKCMNISLLTLYAGYIEVHSLVHLPSPSTVRWVSSRTIVCVLVFPSNSPYLTEYPRMTPLVTIGSLQLMLTLVLEITLYVSPITGSETGRVCKKKYN